MSLLLSSSPATAAKATHLRLYSHRRYHHRPQPQSFLQLSSAAASSSGRVSIREMTETETQMSKSHLSAGEGGCWWRRGAAGGGGAAEGGGPGGGRGRSGQQSPCWAGPARVGRASARARAVGRHWQTRVRPNAYPDPGRVWPGFCPGFFGPGWARAGCWPDPAHLTSLRNNCMLGMASGQLNRLESLRIAFRKAGEEAKGAALASDAFPFAWKDVVEEACQTGSGVIVEPGRREYQTQRRRIAATSMGSLSSSRMRDTSGTERISLLSHF